MKLDTYLNGGKVITEMGQELNRELVRELRWYEENAKPEHVKEKRKELNKQRIAALGLVLIPGGKYEDQ